MLVYIMMGEWITRPCGPDESKSWTEFLDGAFGYTPPHSFAVDFAPLFESEALRHSRLVWKDGEIVSSAILFPATAITATRSLRLGIIGAVATGPRYRGLGLSTQVLRELEGAAATSGLEGIILWSDQREFYAKAGYSMAGRQQIYPLETLAAPSVLTEGTPVYGWDWPQVRAIYERHGLRVDRSGAYWKSLEGIKSCTRVQWISDDGRVLAYLGFDRGKDLHGIVHEWGGEPLALHCLLWTVLQNRPGLLWLTHPQLRDPIRPLLVADPMPGTLGLFKSLSPAVKASDLDCAWFWGLDSL